MLVGDYSTLTISLTDGSTLEGYVSGIITNAKGDTVSTDVGTVSVTLDSTSTWTLTGDSYRYRVQRRCVQRYLQRLHALRQRHSIDRDEISKQLSE